VKLNLLCWRGGAGLNLIVFSLAGMMAGQTGRAKTSPDDPKLSEQVFKNIQILKGIPSEQVIPAMQFISSSLGVDCSFCHVEGALERDDKKAKGTARKMMQMMAVINQANFDGKRKVTCYSCHRGSTRPTSVPFIAEQETPPTPDSTVPQVDKILARYVEAAGGSSAIEKLSTRVAKGHVTLAGKQFPVEVFSKIPDKQMSVIHLPNGDSVTTYDGASGWTLIQNRPLRYISNAEATSARLEADLQLPIHLKQMFDVTDTEKPEKIGDREVYVISAFNAGELAAKLYFDKESGLLVRMVRYVGSPLGLNPTQIDYADYRQQGGVKIPFQETISRFRSRLDIQIDEATTNVPLDDAKFLPPAASSADRSISQ
jgi:photosynthetic reaction center cytochrome c subunit